MNQDPFYIKLLHRCRESAFHSFGYQYIFDKRAIRYSKLVNALKVMGILVPALLGAMVITYNENEIIKNISVAALAVVSIIQFGLSVLAIIYKWDDELSYSFESSQAYNSIYRRLNRLANFPPPDFESLKKEFDLIDTENNAREQQDSKHNITDEERRIGMRCSLREHQKECSACKETPTSMNPSDCDVCGNFKTNKYWII